ncbi:MAG TPA: hypothetical protein VG273_22670 [Bryobacteraceae bacterium]|jgi:hypothetical protein|nr:hypothetical protein [Bryobacteraceae bacterium]
MKPGSVTRMILLLASLSTASPQNNPETDTVLAAARQKILAVTAQLRRYTCLETVDRQYFASSVAAPKPGLTSPESCPAQTILTQPPDRAALASSDRLRLEVAVSDRHEIQSWPGASRFESRRLNEIVGFGPTSSGAFGTYLVEVFDNPGAAIEFVKEKTVEGRRVFEYRFQIPLERSHYGIRVNGDWQTTGTSGSFEIAAASADLGRFTIQTNLLPPGAEMCQAKTSLEYPAFSGGTKYLMPLKNEFQTVHPGSVRTESFGRFSSCHEYTSESTIRFDDESAETAKTGPQHSDAMTFPAGLPVSIKLTAPIDTATGAAGDVVIAGVTKAVLKPGSKMVLIPAGARMRGRISEMRHFAKPSPHFQVGLVFESVELRGVDTPVAMVRDRSTPPPDSRAQFNAYSASKALRQAPQDLNIPPPNAHDGGTFVVLTDKPVWVIPAGFESKWITLAPRP